MTMTSQRPGYEDEFNRGAKYGFTKGVQLTIEFLASIDDLLDLLDIPEDDYPLSSDEKVEFISKVLNNRIYTSENVPFTTWKQFRDVMELAEKILPYLPD